MIPLWARVGALAVPAPFVFRGFWMGLDSLQFMRGSLPAEAEIVSVRAEESRTTRADGRVETVTSYWPTLRFTTATGDEIAAESADAPVPRSSDRVPVRYFAADPEWLRLYYSIWSIWSGPGVGLSAAGVMLAAFRDFDPRARRARRARAGA